MPGGDRTGPAGMGPMTGRRAGYCAGYPAPGYVQPGPGFGSGWGGGWGGFGRRRGFYGPGRPGWGRFGPPPPFWEYGPYPSPTPEEEAEDLKSEAEWLQSQLDAVKRRIEALEKKE